MRNKAALRALWAGRISRQPASGEAPITLTVACSPRHCCVRSRACLLSQHHPPGEKRPRAAALRHRCSTIPQWGHYGGGVQIPTMDAAGRGLGIRGQRHGHGVPFEDRKPLKPCRCVETDEAHARTHDIATPPPNVQWTLEHETAERTLNLRDPSSGVETVHRTTETVAWWHYAHMRNCD